MLPTIVGVGFAGLLALLGFLGKSVIDGFGELRADVSELRTDVAVVYTMVTGKIPSKEVRQRVKDEVGIDASR